MSRSHYKVQSTIMRDVENMSYDQLEETYDIEIDDDGGVYDFTENAEFTNVVEWATFVIERERIDSSDIKSIRSRGEDE